MRGAVFRGPGRTRWFTAGIVVIAAAAACTDSTPPLVPTTITVTQTAVSLDAIGATASVSVTVDDQDGNPMADEPVTWTSSSNAVTITAVGVPAATAAAVGGHVAAQTAGGVVARTVTIRAAAAGTAIVTATARSVSATVTAQVVQVPTAPIKTAGDGQTGIVGAALPEALRIRVQDRLGNPIAGVTVAFAAQGGGSVTPPTASTGADGSASATWTLGTRTSDAQQATVNAAGSTASAVFSATAAPGPATSVTIQAGDAQSSFVGAVVPTAPSVRVGDAFDNPVPGQTVTFTVTSGGGTVGAATAVTNASGIAAVAGWTLGTTPGPNSLAAAIASGAAANFSATGVAGPAANLAIQAGGTQSAGPGAPVAILPAVRITDPFGNPVANVPVVFAVTAGGGTITGANAVTNADGVATVGSWTLGPVNGLNTLTATATGTGIAGNPATFNATASGFEITLQFLSTVTASQSAAFNTAAARWGAIITGDLADLPATLPAGSCGANSTAINGVIDDVLIFVTIAPIDGPGGILGQAGPCFVRTAGALPVIGRMLFDVADVQTLEANGSFGAVVLHEMGHVLGIGSLWTTFGLLQSASTAGGPALDTFFNGVNGIAGFNAIGGATYTGGQKVPVENMFGSGTINSHWRESVLQNELMTGFLNSGPNPLSVLTARSLQDMGYAVNPAGADPFSLTLAARLPGAPELERFRLIDDIFTGPVYAIDAQGRITRIQ